MTGAGQTAANDSIQATPNGAPDGWRSAAKNTPNVKTMAMTERENFLRALEFLGPEWIPVSPAILAAGWMKYREALEDIVLAHPRIFGKRKKGQINFDKMLANHREYERDAWGCLWHNLEPGLLGQSVEHPLAHWEALDELEAPNPLEGDWEKIEANIRLQKQRGILSQGGLGRCLMDTLIALRGFENAMMDLATNPRRNSPGFSRYSLSTA